MDLDSPFLGVQDRKISKFSRLMPTMVAPRGSYAAILKHSVVISAQPPFMTGKFHCAKIILYILIGVQFLMHDQSSPVLEYSCHGYILKEYCRIV
jgi:uncharacterized membrane protein SirB2